MSSESPGQVAEEGERIVVIGLDGATFDLILPWIKQGYLPSFEKLLTQGSHGILTSTIPPETPSAWSSVLTGKNPGNHGVYGFMKIDPKSKRVVPVSSVDRKSKDVYETISEYGKRVVVLNVPLTYPPRKVNGIVVSGFMTPSAATDYAYPPDALDNVEKALGVRYCISLEENRKKAMASVLRSKSYREALAEDLAATTDLHGRTLMHFLNMKNWDFLMIVFQATDQIQHNFWSNASTPDTETSSSGQSDAIRLLYVQIDGIIREILEGIDGKTNLLVISDHGFTGFTRFIGMNAFLMKHGYLRLKRNPVVTAKRIMFSSGITPLRLFRWMNKLHMGQFRQTLRKEEFRRKIRGLFLSIGDVDWGRSKAHSMGGWGQIYLNSKEKYPFGTLDENDSRKLVDEIIEELRDLKDPDTEKKIFDSGRIYRKNEIYSGPYSSFAPDVTALSDVPYKAFPDYEFGSNKLVVDAVAWSGTHSMEGILFAVGPSIIRAEVSVARIIDIAPTILYLLGLPIPEDVDGRVLTEIIRPAILKARPMVSGTAATRGETGEYSYAAADEEDLKKTLKSLGYL